MAGSQFERLVRLFSVLVPAATGGCTDRGIDPEQFTERLCDENGYAMLDDIRPAAPADYVELRDIYADYAIPDEPEMPVALVVDASGELCRTASDPAACADAFAALPYESSMYYGRFDGSKAYRSLAHTRGDTARAATSVADLLEFLGPIDSPADAGVLAVGQLHQLVCDGGNNAAPVDDGSVLYTRTGYGCGEGDDIEQHVVHVTTEGAIEILETEFVQEGDPGCPTGVGRLPAGLCRQRRAPSRSRGPVGRFFAQVAQLETAAITAFGQLHDELAAHDAPALLQRAAARSRIEEIHHARITTALARRYGGCPVVPRVRAWQARSLAEVAADNAVEGCIRETFGAAVATAQAHRAADPAVRRALAPIAVDETRHAALSWSLHQWTQQQLSAPARKRVRQQTADALERLQHELTTEHHEQVHRVTGLPYPDQARRLFAHLRTHLSVT